MKFSDLQFKPHKVGEGIHAVHQFENGYSVSVIQATFSYGGDQGLYELAVLKNGCLHYNNPVANGDVRGGLTSEEVEELANRVERFPALKEK